MKHNVLGEFRKHLQEVVKNKNTADRYYFAVNKLLEDRQFNSLSQIDPEDLKEKLTGIKTKNDFSAAKNGLKHLKEFSEDLQLPDQESLQADPL